LRQLPNERTLVETGQVYHLGAGAKFRLGTRSRGLVRAFGFRVDGRLYLRAGGFGFDDAVNRSLGVSAGMLAAF
jgi:hypothetical protein